MVALETGMVALRREGMCGCPRLALWLSAAWNLPRAEVLLRLDVGRGGGRGHHGYPLRYLCDSPPVAFAPRSRAQVNPREGRGRVRYGNGCVKGALQLLLNRYG